ncbi:MAG: carbohydrate ABC transporter permease, partial [Spirochaetaceae bacterium]|nr:carbohydrate ABC transporter permease [Spirochaetaceae bacterium]
MNGRKKVILLKTALLFIFSLVVLVPLAILILNSLKTREEALIMSLKPPRIFHFENYTLVIRRGGIIRAFVNSMVIASISAVIGIMVSAMGTFVLRRRRIVLFRAIYTYIFIGLMVPINYVSTMLVYKTVGLLNTYTGIILLNAAMGVPFAVFLYYGFVDSIPRELDEAALIDGASPLQLFFTVIFPLLKPATMTAGVLNFIGAWNDFVTPLYMLSRRSMWPMVLSIYNFFG